MKALWCGLLLAAMLCNTVAVTADSLIPSKAVLERAVTEYGEGAAEVLREWQNVLTQTRQNPDLTERQKLEIINDFFNRVPWVSDREHWGAKDYWATPVETLASNGGDCEDFSIGKYVSLRAVGIAENKLRITYVKALNQAHMVLTYYASPDAEPLILDNINRRILPASSRPDLVPFYSFNADRLWLAKERGTDVEVGTPSRLPAWVAVSQRMSMALAQN